MNRPPRRPPPPRSADSLGSRLFDRSDGPPLLLIGVGAAILLVVLWILFLPPFAALRSGSTCQSAGDGYKVCATTKLPAPPVGLAPATRYYNEFALKNSGGDTVSISLPLIDAKGSNQDLSFYTYQAGKWARVAPASPSADGVSAQGQIQGLPGNIIAFRRQAGALEVMGALPTGKAIVNAEAAKLLTTLNPSGFSLTSDGGISGQAPPIAPGAQYQVIPAVQATGGDAAAAFNQILAAQDRQTAHIAQLTQLAARPGFNGVELDYTAVPPDQRQAFSSFVSTLAQELHKSQHLLGLELPAPKLTANGWNTGAYDWGALAKSADYLKLLPDPDQSIYRKQMPDLLKYLISQAGVDPHKIILVTSAYSAEKSDQGVTPRTRLEALSIASSVAVQNPDQAVSGSTVSLVAANLNHDTGGSGLTWDGTTATVSYDYQVGNATHVVWIENQYSEGFKLQYIQINHLGGVAVDDASNDPALGDLWPAIAQYVDDGVPPLLQPNPSLLLPVWQVDGNPLDSGGKTVASWTAPAPPGPHTISLIVSDGVIRVIGSTTLTVRSAPPASSTVGPEGIVAVSATPRPPPPTAATVQRQFGASPTPTSGR